MQIAISIPDEEVDEIDRLVPGEFRSRAEVVRTAVASWLSARRTRELDRRFEDAYATLPQAHDDIDSGRAEAGKPHPWDELEW